MDMDLKTNMCECMETGECACVAGMCNCDCGCDDCVNLSQVEFTCACGGGSCQCGIQDSIEEDME